MSATDRSRRYEASAKGKAARRLRRQSGAAAVSLRRWQATRGKQWRQQRISANRAVVDSLKRAPCADCGGVFDPVCMDFDHRPGEMKRANVSYLVKQKSLDAVLAEVAKCDVVCANCHRIRTKRRGDHLLPPQRERHASSQLGLPHGVGI